jgi:hypothetical protein
VERAKLKAMLPAITPAGVFGDRFTIEQYSGLACIDIDGQDNPQVEDWENQQKTINEEKRNIRRLSRKNSNPEYQVQIDSLEAYHKGAL